MGQLQDQVTFITGAASGIGAATAARFRAEGAVVSTADVAGEADHLLDVRNEDAVAAAIAAIVQTHGRLDVVVNAAGVAGGGPVHMVDGAEWDRVVDVNLKGTFNVCKHACTQMITQKSGSIVNIASIEGIEGTEGGSVYNASKAGVIMLTKSMAIDYGPSGIRRQRGVPRRGEDPVVAESDRPARDGGVPGENARRTQAGPLR